MISKCTFTASYCSGMALHSDFVISHFKYRMNATQGSWRSRARDICSIFAAGGGRGFFPYRRWTFTITDTNSLAYCRGRNIRPLYHETRQTNKCNQSTKQDCSNLRIDRCCGATRQADDGVDYVCPTLRPETTN